MEPRFHLVVRPNRTAALIEPRRSLAVAHVIAEELAAAARDVQEALGSRLKEQRLPRLNFSPRARRGGGDDMPAVEDRVNLLSTGMGKEVAILFWALDGSDPDHYAAIICNWRGLEPEERWWLYTQARASDNNWQAAIRLALAPYAGAGGRR